MAQPGPRPKTASQRILAGTHRTTRHGDKAKAKERATAAQSAFGPLVAPDDPQDAAQQAWVRYIEPCHLLKASKERLAIAFCHLWKEFTDDPKAFSAARHGQLRLYSQELGLSDERARSGVNEVPEDDPFAKFDDRYSS